MMSYLVSAVFNKVKYPNSKKQEKDEKSGVGDKGAKSFRNGSITVPYDEFRTMRGFDPDALVDDDIEIEAENKLLQSYRDKTSSFKEVPAKCEDKRGNNEKETDDSDKQEEKSIETSPRSLIQDVKATTESHFQSESSFPYLSNQCNLSFSSEKNEKNNELLTKNNLILSSSTSSMKIPPPSKSLSPSRPPKPSLSPPAAALAPSTINRDTSTSSPPPPPPPPTSKTFTDVVTSPITEEDLFAFTTITPSNFKKGRKTSIVMKDDVNGECERNMCSDENPSSGCLNSCCNWNVGDILGDVGESTTSASDGNNNSEKNEICSQEQFDKTTSKEASPRSTITKIESPTTPSVNMGGRHRRQQRQERQTKNKMHRDDNVISYVPPLPPRRITINDDLELLRKSSVSFKSMSMLGSLNSFDFSSMCMAEHMQEEIEMFLDETDSGGRMDVVCDVDGNLPQPIEQRQISAFPKKYFLSYRLLPFPIEENFEENDIHPAANNLSIDENITVNESNLVQTYQQLGDNMFDEGHYVEAVDFYERSLEQQRQEDEVEDIIDFSQTEAFHEESNSSEETYQHQQNKVRFFSRLGMACHFVGDLENALEYYEDAARQIFILKTSERSGEKEEGTMGDEGGRDFELATLWIQIGMIHYSNKHYQKANNLCNDALRLTQKVSAMSVDKDYGIYHPCVLLLRHFIGILRCRQGRYEQSLSFLDDVIARRLELSKSSGYTSKERNEQINNDMNNARLLLDLGYVHLKSGDPSNGILKAKLCCETAQGMLACYRVPKEHMLVRFCDWLSSRL